MPFSKFDPHRPSGEEPEATSASGERRIRILRWVNWVVLVYTAIGFGFIAYWLFR